MCPGCDGRCCSDAAGTKARLGDLARFYTYHEDHGMRSVAREEYRRPAGRGQRDWHRRRPRRRPGQACHHKIDFASLLPEVDRLLG